MRHPNIVSWLDTVSIGALFLTVVSEYCARKSVEALTRQRGTLTPDDAVPLVLQALDGLHYAQTIALPNGSIGVRHNNINPANILLTGAGTDTTVKLADFGLAAAHAKASLAGITLAFTARPLALNLRDSGPEVDVWALAASQFIRFAECAP